MVQDQMNEKLSIVEEKLSVVQNQTDMSVEHKIDQALYDFTEREKRKNNVIIYNLPESQVENEEEHGQEEENSVKKICEITEVPFEVVESTTRLGVKKGKDRPLKVIFTNEQDKRKVVKNSARLKQQSSHDKVAITPDYTIRQRENNNKLKSEVAKRRVTDPTFTYRKLKMELSLTNPNSVPTKFCTWGFSVPSVDHHLSKLGVFY